MIRAARRKGLPQGFQDDLDLVKEHFGHRPLDDVCNPLSPEFQPWVVEDVRIQAAILRGDQLPDPWFDRPPEARSHLRNLPAVIPKTRPEEGSHPRESRSLLIQSCDYRAPLPEVGEVELNILPLERCGCPSEPPSVCLAGLSGRPGTPFLARAYDCLQCVSRGA